MVSTRKEMKLRVNPHAEKKRTKEKSVHFLHGFQSMAVARKLSLFFVTASFFTLLLLYFLRRPSYGACTLIDRE